MLLKRNGASFKLYIKKNLISLYITVHTKYDIFFYKYANL